MLKILQTTKSEHTILHLKSTKLQKNFTPKLLNLHHKNNSCLLNLNSQITKINLLIKKYCSYCHRKINHSISACFMMKMMKMMKTNEMLMLDQDLRKTHLYNTSPCSPSNDRTKHCDHRNRSQSTSRNNSLNETYSQIRYRSTSRDRYSYDKNTTPPQYSRSRYDNYKRDSRSYGSPYRSSYRSPYRHNSRSRYRSRSYLRDNNFPRYTNSYRPPSRPRDSRFSRSRSHSDSRNKLNTIQPQDHTEPIKFEVHMYHPTAMAKAATPTSWFYSL